MGGEAARRERRKEGGKGEVTSCPSKTPFSPQREPCAPPFPPPRTPSRQKQLFLVEYSVFCASIAGGEGGVSGFEGEVKNMAHAGPHQ